MCEDDHFVYLIFGEQDLGILGKMSGLCHGFRREIESELFESVEWGRLKPVS